MTFLLSLLHSPHSYPQLLHHILFLVAEIRFVAWTGLRWLSNLSFSLLSLIPSILIRMFKRVIPLIMFFENRNVLFANDSSSSSSCIKLHRNVITCLYFLKLSVLQVDLSFGYRTRLHGVMCIVDCLAVLLQLRSLLICLCICAVGMQFVV